MNLKLNPSGPGLFSLSQSHIAVLISSSLKLSTSLWFSRCPILWKIMPFKFGLLCMDSWNLCRKKLRTSSFTLFGSSIHDPLITTPFKTLNLRCELISRWKYRELQSPSLIHLDLAFCLVKDS